jgi:hypothetical protein
VAAGLVPVIAFLAYTILPAFRVSTVNDALPDPAAGVPSAPTPTPTPTTTPTQPQTGVLARGRLAGIDHRASGRVTLVRLTGDRLLVRLEGLDVEAGPDYQVHLLPGAGRTSPEGGVKLARLKANRGNQNYPVPTGTTVSGPQTVLIWCRAFAVPVANASLS